MQPETTHKPINYIQTQEEHHKKRTFLDEYKEVLKDFGLEYDERYIFKPIFPH